MIPLGIASAAIFTYGIYIMCFQQHEVEIDYDSDSDSYSESDATYDDEFEDAESEQSQEQSQESIDVDSISEQEQENLIRDKFNIVEDEVSEETDDEMPELIDDHEDLWSSYQLEKKYNEMSEKKVLKDYLNLKEWKMGVRQRFREFLDSQGFRKSPDQFIREERNKRNKNEYAIIDDTALNLVEYYQLVSSGDQNSFEMKNMV